jgi:hypothetical protein
MADDAKRGSIHHKGRAAAAEEGKSKSRLAALAPGENIKEKQVRRFCLLSYAFFLCS